MINDTYELFFELLKVKQVPIHLLEFVRKHANNDPVLRDWNGLGPGENMITTEWAIVAAVVRCGSDFLKSRSVEVITTQHKRDARVSFVFHEVKTKGSIPLRLTRRSGRDKKVVALSPALSFFFFNRICQHHLVLNTPGHVCHTTLCSFLFLLLMSL